MKSSRWQPGSPIATAMFCSAVIGAQYVAGKVVRDALFLDVFDGKTALPMMTAATSVFSILLVFLTAKVSKRVPPASYVPAAFAFSALLLLLCWATVSTAPRAAAIVVYLQVSGLGPVLGSGFWLLTSERLDPRTGKKRFGQIAGAGTLGGLLTAFAPAPSATAMLPVLAVLNVLCAWQVRRLGATSTTGGRLPRPSKPEPAVSGLKVLRSAPYLQNLATLVLLGTIGAIVMDYLFKTQVAAALGKNKLQFFKIYYPAVNTITFILQTIGARPVLQTFGIGVATCLPSLALLAGSIGSMIVPGLRGVVATRGSESVFRGSLYRSGYEVFFTPVPPHEKRAVKSAIDVGFDRFGDLIGAAFMQVVLFLPASQQSPVLLSVVVVCSAAGLFIATRLTRGYQHALEHSLLSRGDEVELPEVEDPATRTVLLRTAVLKSGGLAAVSSEAAHPAVDPGSDPVLAEIHALRSNDSATIRRVLKRDKGLPAALVPHVIPLLAWDDLAPDCVRALRSVAEERVGALIDALLDPNQPFVVRRRLARVFFVCVSQRAADGLLLGLEDGSFEVRFQSGRSLLAILEKNPKVHVDQQRVFAIAEKEVAVNVDVWQKRAFLDESSAGDTRALLEEVVRDRASQALAHVFTLLALVLPTEPMRIAFLALHTTDQNLRGTALDYLDSVVPAAIKTPLWPFIEDGGGRPRQPRSGGQALTDLMKSHASIMVNLEELRKRRGEGAA